MEPIRDLNKQYYKISEVADIIGLPASTLRFWEKSFTIINPKRNAHGSRFYTPEDIDKIRQIHYLVKEKGLKLDAAQEALKKNPEGIDKTSDAITRLKEIKAELLKMLDALDRMR